VQLAATTGLDRGVITRLSHADIDFDARQFNLMRFKISRPVYPYVHDALVKPLRLRVARVPVGQPLLQGLHHQGGAQDWWKKAVSSAGLASLRFVDLRTYAANWLRSILGDFEAQKILGHSRPDVTAKHYYQTNPESQRLISKRSLPGTATRRGTRKTSSGDKRA